MQTKSSLQREEYSQFGSSINNRLLIHNPEQVKIDPIVAGKSDKDVLCSYLLKELVTILQQADQVICPVESQPLPGNSEVRIDINDFESFRFDNSNDCSSFDLAITDGLWKHSNNTQAGGNPPSYADSMRPLGCVEEVDDGPPPSEFSAFAEPLLDPCANCVRHRRALKALIDLICIEPDPGPSKKSTKMVVYNPNQQKKSKRKNLGQMQKGRNTVDAAVPGRYPTPRSVTFGGSQMASYMRCLNDPFNEPPCRPGVGCAIPSGLFSCYQRITVTTSGTGNTSFTFMSSRILAPLMTSNTAAAPYTYGVSGGNYPQAAAINALYEKARLLASGIRLIPLQNSTADQGQIAAALIPSVRVADVLNFGQITTGSALYGFNEMVNFPQTLVSPFKVGTSLYWRPQDPNSFAFREACLNDSATTSPSSSFAQETLQAVPFLMIATSGTASAAQYTLEMISHFEGTIAAGNAGVIDLQRAPPVDEGTALRAVDRVFGDTNRTARIGYSGPFNPNVPSSNRNPRQVAGRRSGSDLFSDVLSFGSSVAPLLLGLL